MAKLKGVDINFPGLGTLTPVDQLQAILPVIKKLVLDVNKLLAQPDLSNLVVGVKDKVVSLEKVFLAKDKEVDKRLKLLENKKVKVSQLTLGRLKK